MRRHEAVALLAFGLVLLVGGVTWVFGGWGLAGTGLLLIICGLFFDFTEPTKPKSGEGT